MKGEPDQNQAQHGRWTGDRFYMKAEESEL